MDKLYAGTNPVGNINSVIKCEFSCLSCISSVNSVLTLIEDCVSERLHIIIEVIILISDYSNHVACY